MKGKTVGIVLTIQENASYSTKAKILLEFCNKQTYRLPHWALNNSTGLDVTPPLGSSVDCERRQAVGS